MPSWGPHDLAQRVANTREAMKKWLDGRRPEVAVILGSGLGKYAESLEDGRSIAYSEFPEFGQTYVQGHAGQLWSGQIEGREALLFQGRPGHRFEGFDFWQLMLPVWAARGTGAGVFIVTSAVGSTRAQLTPQSIVAVSGHINLRDQDPLFGINREEFYPKGARGFLNVNNLYDEGLRKLASDSALALGGGALEEGVLYFNPGRSYETPAEIRAIQTLGGDLVGMSMIYEMMAAHGLRARCLGLACVTNYAAGVEGSTPDHAEVTATAALASEYFAKLLTSTISRLPQP